MENTAILASMIIPVYNVESYLKECLDSIFLHQKISYPMEVIIVNDGSTDGSLAILDEYKKQYDFILINQENTGVSSARNAGIKIAKGKYLLFMDSDDYLVPNALDKLLVYLSKADVDLVEFDYEILNQTGLDLKPEPIEPGVLSGKGEDIFCEWRKMGLYRVAVWTKAVRREMVISNRIYFYSGIFYEDEEWCPKLFAYAKSVSYLPIRLYVYRIRGGSNTSKKTRKHNMDLFLIIDSLYEFSCKDDLTEKYIKCLRYIISVLYFSIIKGIRPNGEYDEELISKLEERKNMIVYSHDLHRKYLYRFIINIFGIKRFYVFKYGFKDFIKNYK